MRGSEYVRGKGNVPLPPYIFEFEAFLYGTVASACHSLSVGHCGQSRMQQVENHAYGGFSADGRTVRAVHAGAGGRSGDHQPDRRPGCGHAVVYHRHRIVGGCAQPAQAAGVHGRQSADRSDGGLYCAGLLAVRHKHSVGDFLGLSGGFVLIGHRFADFSEKGLHQHSCRTYHAGHPRFSGYHGCALHAVCAAAGRSFDAFADGGAVCRGQGDCRSRRRPAGSAFRTGPAHGCRHGDAGAGNSADDDAGPLLRHCHASGIPRAILRRTV